MRKISKGLAIAVTVMAIGGASLAAVAQPAGPGQGPMGYGPMGFMHGPGGYGMMGGQGGWGAAGFADPAARLDALKTQLAIRPEQTAAWDAYVKAVRDSVEQTQAIRGSIDFDKLRTMSWTDHLAYMGQIHDRQAAAFKSVDAAATTLLAALDDTQKGRVALSELENFGTGMMGGGYGMMGWGPGRVR